MLLYHTILWYITQQRAKPFEVLERLNLVQDEDVDWYWYKTGFGYEEELESLNREKTMCTKYQNETSSSAICYGVRR